MKHSHIHSRRQPATPGPVASALQPFLDKGWLAVKKEKK